MMINGNTMLNPPPIPAAADFGPALAIMAMVADPEASKARLDQLAAASAECRSVVAEAAQAQKDLAAAKQAHDKTLADDAVAAAAKLSQAQTAFDVACDARKRALDERDQRLSAAEAKAKADADAAAALKAELERKLATIRTVAA
jgi:hypothetical protein